MGLPGVIGGGFNSNIFYFHRYLGKIPILTNIFQLGWFNHQLANVGTQNSHIWVETINQL